MEEKSPDDKMTAKRIAEEYGMGKNTVYRMFNDPELPVQKVTYPYFVLRSELLKYFSTRHESFSED